MEQMTPGSSSNALKVCSPTEERSEGFGLLDALILFAENLKLLVIGPAIVALIAFGVASFIPKTYTSLAYLGPFDEKSARGVEGLVRSPVVLDAVLRKQPASHESREKRRRMLERKISWSIAAGSDRKSTSLYTLAVSDSSPQRALAVNAILIDAWLEATKPPLDARSRLETQLARSEIQLKSVSTLIERLERETPTLVIPGFLNELASPLASLLEMRQRHLQKIDELKLALAGTSRDVIVTPPSEPAAHAWPSRLHFVSVAALAAECFLLLVVWLLHALRVASKRPDTATKLERLRTALRLRHRSK